MSARETSHSHDLDDNVDTAVHERIVDVEPIHEDLHEAEEPRRPRERGPRRTDAAREKILRRRRETLLALGGFFLVALVLAILAGSWTWVIAAAAGVATAAYVIHLRNETRREEERRLTRDIRANRARPDALERRSSDSQSSLAANAFVAPGAVSAPEPVLLDDEDPEFFGVGDSTVSDSVDLSGRRYYSEYQDSPDYYDWDDDHGTSRAGGYSDVEYDDPDYGIGGRRDVAASGHDSGDDGPHPIRPAV